MVAIMCSIFKYNAIVGRNFDYDVSYNETIRHIHKSENPFTPKYNIIGVATGLTEYPLLYDGMNSNGLVVGGLAFTGNAYYIESDKNDKLNIPAYDFTLRILSECGSVQEIKDLLRYIKITDETYESFPNSELHWFAADKTKSIIIEQTKDGLHYYDGSVMTNNPSYPQQTMICNGYQTRIKKDNSFNDTRGTETCGLVGDYTSEGRFARLTYLKDKLENTNNNFNPVTQAFHLCSCVEQVYGATRVNNAFEYTIYSIVYDMNNLKVYYKSYDNLKIKEENII